MHLDLPARIGVISDTHGVLDSGIPGAFEGVDAIVHAGDIGGPDILLALEAIAPVIAVRGNTDRAVWSADLPDTAYFSAGELRAMVVHDAAGIRVPPSIGLVISGHTHRPLVDHRGGVLHLNPGSATESRVRGTSPSIGLLAIDDRGAHARIAML